MKQKGFINKNILMVLAGMVILFLAAIGFSQRGRDGGKQPESNEQANQEPKVSKADLPQDQLPSGFPVGVPVEKGAVITQNYEATNGEGSHQATRVFESGKSVARNYDFYLKFLGDDDWSITNKVEDENLAFITAEKGETTFLVSISKNSLTGAVSVDLTAVFR